jgi:hypothetical protein
MKRAICVSAARNAVVVAFVAIVLLQCSLSAFAKTAPPPKACGAGGSETLTQIRDSTQDLQVVGICFVKGTLDPGRKSLLFVFHDVNILSGGKLEFDDGVPIDFYAESIVVENLGKLTAVGTSMAGYSTRLTIHLWGASVDDGIECQTKIDQVNNIGPCGVPFDVWNSNPGMAQHLAMQNPTPPTHPKNAPCVQTSKMPVTDCFYQYEVQDAQDRNKGLNAYFGHKVLAVSYGGTLQLEGAKGSTLANPANCKPMIAGNECNPATTGTSWVRLTGVSADKKTLTLSAQVDWQDQDEVVVTTTDYLPGHSEQVVLKGPAQGNTITLSAPLENSHNASLYPLPAVDPVNGPSSAIGPQDDPNRPDVVHAVDTRAVVGLLTRNIQIVSEGNTPQPDAGPDVDTFPPTPGNYFGGHTIVRQGFLLYQVQGVEFYRLGQGGAKGRYPVHFHMVRKTQQPATEGQPPVNYLKDCSIHDSMTRWITLHATEGMYLARNVGYLSIGHGYYLEDATETDNKLYANLGVFVRAAVINPQNPRQVPGILADTSNTKPPAFDGMPYRSDYNHPTVFWIMNGWNDFQYNYAAGAATCGACYWWLPGANSGPSQYQHWSGYASQQIFDPAGSDGSLNNFPAAGYTPLKSFVGNACVAAMSSFQTVGATNDCIGVNAFGNTELAAVPTNAPVPSYDVPTKFDLYYPSVTALRNPTVCANYNNPTTDCSNGASPPAPVCDSNGNSCAATVIDHYTTSFNFAQTNFSAVWLRPKWFLVRNAAITDVQTGGLNFVTGGGYTRSDIPLGYWSVVRHSAFIGHSQPYTANKVPANEYASDAGPFNPYSQLECDTPANDHCLSVAQGVSFQLPPFPGQRLFNIYDGPAFQELNYYLDINTTTLTDCSPGSGNCPGSLWPLSRNIGVLQEKPSSCYVPNAAIAWKQPNGFYYPPAFNSKNLWFSNVDIRHFVVEPFFTSNPSDPYDPFYQDQPKIMNRYCTYNGGTFNGFNHIDRQTVLNDDDGSLTGLLAKEITNTGTITRATISINEDDYFNSPLITPECLSDVGVAPFNPSNLPYTARTSPYEWLSTAMIAKCAIPVLPQTPNKAQCLDAGNTIHWAHECTNPNCRGVPLYREYIDDSDAGKQPEIRMMGQDKAQRSTLTLNHAAYYIDTTQNCNSQGGCSTCTPDPMNANNCFIQGNSRPSIFQGGQTYYVFFIYAKPSTHQTYDIYVGPTLTDQIKVTPARLNLPGDYEPSDVPSGGWITTKPDPTTGTVRVTLDLSGESTVFQNSVSNFCQPASFCAMKTSGGKQVCGCAPGNPQCIDDAVCAWGTNELDCPMDPNNPGKMGCYGFSFTMPQNFHAPDTPIPPATSLFVNYTTNPYFAAGNVTLTNMVKANGGACAYNAPPVQP